MNGRMQGKQTNNHIYLHFFFAALKKNDEKKGEVKVGEIKMHKYTNDKQ